MFEVHSWLLMVASCQDLTVPYVHPCLRNSTYSFDGLETLAVVPKKRHYKIFNITTSQTFLLTHTARYGEYMDPFGLIWCVSNSTNPLQDVPEELARKVVPFVSIRDATSYLAFLSEAFGAQEMYPPSKDPTGKVCGGRDYFHPSSLEEKLQ